MSLPKWLRLSQELHYLWLLVRQDEFLIICQRRFTQEESFRNIMSADLECALLTSCSLRQSVLDSFSLSCIIDPIPVIRSGVDSGSATFTAVDHGLTLPFDKVGRCMSLNGPCRRQCN